MAFEGQGGEAAAGAGGSAADLLTGGVPAGDPPAGDPPAGDPPAGDPPAGGGAADPDWYANVSAETADGETASNRDYIKAKGFKDIDGLAKAYRNAEKALHDKGAVKIPGEGASEAEVTAWREAIGVPADPKGYELAPIMDANGEPVPLDLPLLERLAVKAHEIGVPKAAYEGLVNDFVQGQLEMAAAADIEAKAEGASWAKEQGDKATAKLNAVNRGAEALGLSGEDVLKIRAALGTRRALDTLSRLGENIGEDVLLHSDGGGRKFIMSGDQAQAEMDAMKADPKLAAAILRPGSPENAKWKRLEAIVGDAANRKAQAGL